ncbi:50S ribosomal protein L25/general stress protein Ctc [Bacillus sp. JJ1764]|uniref:50S ribosomal protein L25/general stress protein Ctc n=1 Tax=Bacillus sp. JJ1764 TaxID=3122964 RepID=UPI002FFE93D3
MSTMLVAKERFDFRKSALHQLRGEGKIPSVVYGKHEESKAITVNNADLLKVIRKVGRNGIISLNVNGHSEDVILADYQYNPISHDILHADFHHINMSTKIHVLVHVVLTGSSESTEIGGILQQSLHELNISAKPKDIPETIEVDISKIKIGHTIKIGDIRQNYSNIVINHEDDEVIVTALASKIEEESTEEQQDEKKEKETATGSQA